MRHPPLTFEYSRITSSLYVGTNQCCQTHFSAELLKKGITADVSLEENQLDNPFGVRYFLWLPTKDHTALSLPQLNVGIQFLRALQKQRVKCYVHCQHGHGRAPTLVAAYLISTGMTTKEAITLVKKKRPSVHLNNRQIAALKKFARLST